MSSISEILDKFPEELKPAVLDLITFLSKQKIKMFVKEEMLKVWEVIKELAEAQKRTEERLESFKKSTEENFNKVWKSINELSEAQKKTEERLSTLEVKMAELAEAQKKTEIRLNELAEAQKKTEKSLQKLTKEHGRTREILMGISDTVSYGLEDKIIPYIKSFAKAEYNIDVKLVDRRNIVYSSDGSFDEVNIYAEGRRNGEKVYLLGECKSKPSKKDVEKMIKKAKRIKEYIKSNVEVFIVGYYYSPEVERFLKEREKEIKYFKSFDFGFKYK